MVGSFTPNEYREFIENTLGDEANIIELKHYLQDGYEKHLKDKVELLDSSMNSIRLPDSTCLIVIEKK